MQAGWNVRLKKKKIMLDENKRSHKHRNCPQAAVA